MHTVTSTLVKRRSVQSQYIYFICRKINPVNPSLTDFVAKVGRGTQNRWKNYGTAYSSDYTTYIWMTEMANEHEKRILFHLKNECMLRKHVKGKYAEVLSIPCIPTDTISHCIVKYEETCIETITYISNVVGTDPTHIYGADIRKEKQTEKVEIPTRPSLWQRFVSFVKRRL